MDDKNEDPSPELAKKAFQYRLKDIEETQRIDRKVDAAIQERLNEREEASGQNKPHCFDEGGRGYIRFGKRGKKQFISGYKAQPYVFLDMLVEELGVARSVDSIIERLPTTNRSSLHADDYTGKANKLATVRNIIKTLQKKDKGLQGKLQFIIDEAKQTVRVVQL